MIEYFDELDKNGIKTGKVKTKEQIKNDGNFYKIVHLWIINPTNNKILVQQRSSNKKTDPNCWDLSCGGHVQSKENDKDAIIREAKEELGIDISSENLINIYENKHHTKSYFYTVFLLVKDINIKDLILQKEKVQNIKYFSIEELESLFKEKSNIFIKPSYFNKILDFIKKD